MRRARPHELKVATAPLLTARVSAAELSKWVPIKFEEITDPLETAEPSKGALVRLDNGDYFVLFYGKDSRQLTVEIPEATKDSSAALSAFLREVPLPTSRILWLRSGAELPGVRAKRSALRVAAPRKRH
jgi:hypothetical protein